MTRTIAEIEELFKTDPLKAKIDLTVEERRLWEASCSITKAINTQVIEKQPSIAEVLVERGTRYGPFAGHAQITQGLKHPMQISPNWEQLEDSQREALEMIAHKIGRILNGDPNYLDSWVDIVGYAQFVIDELQEKAK